eukprot:1544427-Ditylum_brightwellii.AAC.1
MSPTYDTDRHADRAAGTVDFAHHNNAKANACPNTMTTSATLASLLQGQTPEEIADLLATVLRASSTKQEEE